MQAQSARPVRTFTIGFHESDYDEAAHARAVAAHRGDVGRSSSHSGPRRESLILNWKDVLRPLVPLRIRHFRERLELGALRRIACDPRSLAATSVEELREIFQSRSLDQEWSRVERDLSSFEITENADGVNRGD